ncbi:hypothetical protein B0H14DRAFT_562008 [Mycena olivaceomarginata]|nr:hypothetical protein B0H14DRAFT_562008 [Mycena olivaceomarginata]
MRSTTSNAHPRASSRRGCFCFSKWPQRHSPRPRSVDDPDFGYDLGDTTLLAKVQDTDSDGIILKLRRKVYENSDYPMLTWAEHQDEYLDEMIRLEGQEYASIYSKCGGCGEPNPRFRCAQQTCFGLWLYCQKCVVARHAFLPTHWIQEWNGTFFERRSLKDLNLVVQLGHPPGTDCNNPEKATKTFVIIDVTGVQYVALNFCNCDSRVSGGSS